MLPRTERLLAWIALLAALVIVVVALLEINKREKVGPSVAAPTPVTSPLSSGARAPRTAAPAASPKATPVTPAVTRPIALPATPKESVSPPSTPTPTPPLPSPTPLHIPGASATPHTGGGALPAGLAFIGAAALIAVVGRRAY